MSDVLTQQEAMEFCRCKKELFAQLLEVGEVSPIRIGKRTNVFLKEELIDGLKRVRDKKAHEAHELNEAAEQILGVHK